MKISKIYCILIVLLNIISASTYSIVIVSDTSVQKYDTAVVDLQITDDTGNINSNYSGTVYINDNNIKLLYNLDDTLFLSTLSLLVVNGTTSFYLINDNYGTFNIHISSSDIDTQTEEFICESSESIDESEFPKIYVRIDNVKEKWGPSLDEIKVYYNDFSNASYTIDTGDFGTSREDTYLYYIGSSEQYNNDRRYINEKNKPFIYTFPLTKGIKTIKIEMNIARNYKVDISLDNSVYYNCISRDTPFAVGQNDDSTEDGSNTREVRWIMIDTYGIITTDVQGDTTDSETTTKSATLNISTLEILNVTPSKFVAEFQESNLIDSSVELCIKVTDNTGTRDSFYSGYITIKFNRDVNITSTTFSTVHHYDSSYIWAKILNGIDTITLSYHKVENISIYIQSVNESISPLSDSISFYSQIQVPYKHFGETITLKIQELSDYALYLSNITNQPLINNNIGSIKLFNFTPYDVNNNTVTTLTCRKPYPYNLNYTSVNSSNENLYRVFYNNSANNWDYIGGTVYPDSDYITVYLTHFSVYGIFQKTVTAEPTYSYRWSTKLFSPNNDGINDYTNLNLYLTESKVVDITIADITGERVAQLIDKETLKGDITIQWSGKNSYTNLYCDIGPYIYIIKIGDTVKKGVLVITK